MRIHLVCLVLAFVVCLSVASPAQTKKLKIYLSADMEGVVGAVTGDQLGPQGFEYNRFREFMTEEVKTATEAAFEAGATEVVISDSHGNGENLLIEKLPKNVHRSCSVICRSSSAPTRTAYASRGKTSSRCPSFWSSSRATSRR